MIRIAIIERCGHCEHGQGASIAGQWQYFCQHPSLGVAGRDLPGPLLCLCSPPDWCPLTPAADAARVKPLAWQPIDRHGFVRAKLPYRRYAVGKNYRGELVVVLAGRKGVPCDSLEAGKAACEEHYRAALFAPNGPLVQIVAATTAEAAPSETQANNHG